MRMVKPATKVSILKKGELGSWHRTHKQTPGFLPGAFFCASNGERLRQMIRKEG